ncbi:ABC transporter ATP-binding protein [Auritidibacter ignavus]|uniref:ABC transporter ATP-binding protein n=1 Tax=Auritidibacter ignavus TaxID=678932 RepID=UPI00109C946E|nr:ABC transporter ATP-binding protein [Auritidibacter ignavus]
MSMDRAAHLTMFRLQRHAGQSHPGLRPGTIARCFRFLGRYQLRVLGYVAVSILGAALTIVSPILAGRVVDAIVEGHSTEDVGIVIRLALLIAAVAVAEAILAVLSRWQSAALGERVIFDLRTQVFDHIQTMSVAFFTRARTGSLVSRVNNDVLGAQTGIARTFPTVVMNVVTLILTLIVMLTTSWQITVLALVLLPIFLLPARALGNRLAALTRARADHQAAMGSHMTEDFSAAGSTLIKLFGDAEKQSARFRSRADRVRGSGVEISIWQSVFTTLLTLVSALALAAVYGIGGWQAIVGDLNAGEVVTMALLLTRLYTPLTGLATARVELMSALVSFDRIFEILDLTPYVLDPEHPRTIPAGPIQVVVKDVDFWHPRASDVSLASLEDVAQLHDETPHQVLHQISFELKPGETVALVGSSGAGKSTIASLLGRLYDPVAGSITFNGIDLRDTSQAQVHSRMGMVTQDAHLLHDTIRRNLTLDVHESTDEQLLDVLERAQLGQLMTQLPHGLDTVVGDRGYRLSGGQRQRLAIARVLLAQPDLVVLDEATASLDSTSEQAVHAALDEVLTGRSAVVIAHRLSTVVSAHHILVVEDGHIIERGTHSQLVSAHGRYAELYRTQFATDD